MHKKFSEVAASHYMMEDSRITTIASFDCAAAFHQPLKHAHSTVLLGLIQWLDQHHQDNQPYPGDYRGNRLNTVDGI